MSALLSEFRDEVVQTSRSGGQSEERVHADRLAHGLHLDLTLWEDVLAALDHRQALLFVGPSATGKTYLARRLAIHQAGHEDRVLLLRLHPELGYEQLMDGPSGPGLVRALCQRASDDRDQRYCLILDELDRGDAGRALGEFFGCLSERGRYVRLGRSHSLFHVPRNLTILATARSLPHDPAITGRLPIVTLPADSEVLRRFLAHRKGGFEWVADLHAALNRQLEADGHALRIGHALLMDSELDVTRLRGIWRRELLPLLRTHGINDKRYTYEALQKG
jgi:5-methylcytosine-specific restriction protein B